MPDVLDLVFMEQHDGIFTGLAHDLEEQVCDAFVDGRLLLAGGAIRTSLGAFTSHQDVDDWQVDLLEKG